jgi:hypothetical protein
MSAAKKAKPIGTNATAAVNTPGITNTARGITIPSITIPTLYSLFTPSQTMAVPGKTSTDTCNCGCCCQTSTKVCFTFDTTALQNLVNMIPKINITNSNSCSDPDCDCGQP